METPSIKPEQVKLLLDAKFIRLYDLQYAPGKHYYDASRREAGELAAVKPVEEFRRMLPDAVSCYVILRVPGQEPRLLLFYEYRYPLGQFLLSPPAGLLDAADAEAAAKDPQGEPATIRAARREIFEETGVTVKESDRIFEVSPLVLSTPGMTDESNALICAVVDLPDLSCLTQSGAVGSELFRGFELVTESQAREILKNGRDRDGIFYSLMTWSALMYFISGFWKE